MSVTCVPLSSPRASAVSSLSHVFPSPVHWPLPLGALCDTTNCDVCPYSVAHFSFTSSTSDYIE